MKIKNYPQGYRFDCVINGSIEMTREEWRKVKKDMRATLFRYEDISHCIIDSHGNELYNIRVTATRKLVEKYKLKGYKHQNYQIKVLKHE